VKAVRPPTCNPDIRGTTLQLRSLRRKDSGVEEGISAFLWWIQSTASFTLNYSNVDEAASIIRRLIA
jgi:hypothetical protein